MNPPSHSNFLLALLLLRQIFVGLEEVRERGADMEFVRVDTLPSILLLLHILSPQFEVLIRVCLLFIYLKTVSRNVNLQQNTISFKRDYRYNTTYNNTWLLQKIIQIMKTMTINCVQHRNVPSFRKYLNNFHNS